MTAIDETLSPSLSMLSDTLRPKMSFSTKQLQHLLARALNVNAETLDRYLAHYGMQSTGDLADFLHSPEGVAVQELMHEQSIELAEEEENVLEQMQAAEKLQHRRACFLLLALAHKKTAHAHLLEAYQAILDQQAHHQHEMHEQENDTHHRQEQAELFSESIEVIEHTIQEKHVALNMLLKPQPNLTNNQTARAFQNQTSQPNTFKVSKLQQELELLKQQLQQMQNARALALNGFNGQDARAKKKAEPFAKTDIMRTK